MTSFIARGRKAFPWLLSLAMLAALAIPASASASIVPDAAFNANSEGKFGSNGAYYIVRQSDGKILVGGAFSTYNGTSSPARLVRLNADGTDDSAFNAALGTGFNNSIQNIHQLSNGKILVSGSFSSFNGSTRGRMVLLNEDGMEDATFLANVGTGFAGSGIFSVREQSDGKIIIGGAMSTLNGNAVSQLVRLNADGTPDAAFNANLKTLNSFVRDMEIQPSGKIVLAGGFTTYDGNARNRIMRLNADGTEDLAFASTTGTGFNSFIFRSSQDASGNLFFGGDFTTYNGSASNYVIKTSSEGVIDAAFNTNIGTGVNDDLISVRVATSTGKVLLGGNSSMTMFNGATSSRIARLNNDGTYDTEFGTAMGTGFNGQMQYVQQFGNDIYAAGTFTTFNGATSTRFMKFVEIPSDTTPPTLSISSAASAPISSPFTITITASEDIIGFTSSDVQATNATVSDFVSTVASTTWTALITPTAAGTISVTIPASGVTDLSSNANTVAGSFSIVSSFGSASGSGSAPASGASTGPSGRGSTVSADFFTANNPFVRAGIYDLATALAMGRAAGYVTATNVGTYAPLVCEPYLKSYIRIGSQNDPTEVRKLETFLNSFEGENLVVDGIYSQADFEAVKRFQQRNSPTLSFWGISAPTGYVYVSTLKAINRKYCEKTVGVSCPYFNTYHQEGNVSPEVSRIKTFLNNTQGEALAITDLFGADLTAAVKRFQIKFASKVLAPWGLSQPTGNWYQSTKKGADDVLGCFAPVRLDNGKVLE